jgi:phenol hydroxylase P1 protein
MQIDLRTVTIEPQRQAFDHLVRRFGDKPASRYQEGSYDIQPAENLHYRPTWDPDQALYDASITRVAMRDWYALKDPRQFYYGAYTLVRARQQETAETNFRFVDSRGMAGALPQELRELAVAVLVPLRHAAWGANQHNTFICGYGYGTVLTQACMFHAMDNLAIAQYLSRLGLLLGGTSALEAGKHAWLAAAAWQGLRRYVEDCWVLRDPIELFVAQNLALDGLLYPLVYGRVVDNRFSARGGSAIALLTQFMSEWFDETRAWVDAVLKVMAGESEHNRAVLGEWVRAWRARAAAALLPAMVLALDGHAATVVEDHLAAFDARAGRLGIPI